MVAEAALRHKAVIFDGKMKYERGRSGPAMLCDSLSDAYGAARSGKICMKCQ